MDGDGLPLSLTTGQQEEALRRLQRRALANSKPVLHMARSATYALIRLEREFPEYRERWSDPFALLLVNGPAWIDNAIANAEAWRNGQDGGWRLPDPALSATDMTELRREKPGEIGP
jgi:hypothetical protein